MASSGKHASRLNRYAGIELTDRIEANKHQLLAAPALPVYHHAIKPPFAHFYQLAPSLPWPIWVEGSKKHQRQAKSQLVGISHGSWKHSSLLRTYSALASQLCQPYGSGDALFAYTPGHLKKRLPDQIYFSVWTKENVKKKLIGK